MKRTEIELKPRYIVDASGKKTEVILNIDAFEKLIDRLEDFYLGAMAERIAQLDTEEHDLEDVRRRLLSNDAKK